LRPTAEKGDKMKKAFVCPYCKEAAGWREETPIHRHYSAFFDKDGIFFDESYSDNISYDYKLTTYKCLKCNRNIKEAILKYRKEPGND
jgi:DNA-directed RNA polymerase subunit RPC12/RpoP